MSPKPAARQKKSKSNDLLLENRARKVKIAGNVLQVSFPCSERPFLKSLGGFLKLKKTDDKKNLSGQLIFPSSRDADTVLAGELPAGVVLKRAAPQLPDTDRQSLKITGIPEAAGISDVAALFPESTTIMLKELRRVNFFFGSDKEFRSLFGKEAVVRFATQDDCRDGFERSKDSVRILGHEVAVTLGQRNKKTEKAKRKKQRSIRKR